MWGRSWKARGARFQETESPRGSRKSQLCPPAQGPTGFNCITWESLSLESLIQTPFALALTLSLLMLSGDGDLLLGDQGTCKPPPPTLILLPSPHSLAPPFASCLLCVLGCFSHLTHGFLLPLLGFFPVQTPQRLPSGPVCVLCNHTQT